MIGLSDLQNLLQYDKSSNFLRAGTRRFETAPSFGHIFRKASERRGLKGVYTLQHPQKATRDPLVPVVYFCEAASDDEADKTHRLVWNQDVVPFLIVHTPQSVRLYSGFRHRSEKVGPAAGLLRVFKNLDIANVEVREFLSSFNSAAIDDGSVWSRWGKEVNREDRVDWRLLGNLSTLDGWLRNNAQLNAHVSHSLIGKYVYLHYLRDRGILSDRKFDSWEIDPKTVFGRDATIKGLRELSERLEEWLNGGLFPINWSSKQAPKSRHVRQVAATFAGDEPVGTNDWQLHLDFQAYDFSYIPIETLSVVYEQFLHTPATSHLGDTSRGRQAGAYYTPIPLVNFMLTEIDDLRPLKDGMSVLDPSCGSGAFLVQCFRKLVERTFPPTGEQPRPVEVRDLLIRNIYGVDRDPDACGVTELSLIMTLLDYVDPPDLESDRRIKLPALRNQNIFCSSFFAEDLHEGRFGSKQFEWIVGNPPWKKLNPKDLSDDDQDAWENIVAFRVQDSPVGGNQLAQAFIWGIEKYIAPKGVAAILMPAMTLFEDPSQKFRKAFFSRMKTYSIANFSNLAEVLFAGRSRVPSAAIFFTSRKQKSIRSDEAIDIFTPLIANQESTRPVVANRRNKTWNIILNASEIRRVQAVEAATGNGLPWKIAAWGSYLDTRLICRIKDRYPSLGALEHDGILCISEGPQLRMVSHEGVREFPQKKELIGKSVLNTNALAKRRHMFVIPNDAIEINDASYVRSGIDGGLTVCAPPHVIVSAARNFAIYSNKYVIVPPRQIGISCVSRNADYLKALALYLSSDFAYYHQFFSSTELGVKRDRATLTSLRSIPIPNEEFSGSRLGKWVSLHGKLAEASAAILDNQSNDQPLFDRFQVAPALSPLLSELNELVAIALNLTDSDKALVQDLVHYKLPLNDGKLGDDAVSRPNAEEMEQYRQALMHELNVFIEGQLDQTHDVNVFYDEASAMISIELVSMGASIDGSIVSIGDEMSSPLNKLKEKLRRNHSQWVYFDRSLRIYDDARIYLFKPRQRFHWSRSQATLDANEIIAETLAAGS